MRPARAQAHTLSLLVWFLFKHCLSPSLLLSSHPLIAAISFRSSCTRHVRSALCTLAHSLRGHRTVSSLRIWIVPPSSRSSLACIFIFARAPEAAYLCVYMPVRRPAGPSSPHLHPHPDLSPSAIIPLRLSLSLLLAYIMASSLFIGTSSLFCATPFANSTFSVPLPYYRFRCIFIHCFRWFVKRVGLVVSVGCI